MNYTYSFFKINWDFYYFVHIDVPYYLGCYETEKGDNEVSAVSTVDCLVHCKVQVYNIHSKFQYWY